MKTLKELRQDTGLTQQDVANLVSKVVPVSRAVVATWENNNVCPSYPIVMRLAEIYVVQPNEIFEIFYPKKREAK